MAETKWKKAPAKAKSKDKPKVKMSASSDYEAHKAATRQRQADQSAAGREIGPLPAVADPKRRAKCEKDTLLFGKTYFPKRFKWKFSKNHELAAELIDECVFNGGLFAEAMPRGDGKTSIAEVAVIKALVYGHRKYAVLLQATEGLAGRSLKKIQREFESNPLLAADFPEVCYPIRRLERIHNRAKGQTLDGEGTRIEWTAEGIRLPTVKGSKSSGALIDVIGITGAVRGRAVYGDGGEIIRPDFVLIDDAQTKDSAKSKLQTDDRELIIKDDVLGLAGPDVNISAVMLCTVICPDDLSDRMLDPDKNPEWRGLRTKMLDSMPTNMVKWDEYYELRREEMRGRRSHKESNAFYRRNRAEMDAGAKSSWEERKKPGTISSIQSAMNLYLMNPRGFMAEYQNDPQEGQSDRGSKQNDATMIASRLNGLEKGEMPRETSVVSCMVDVGGNVHWYAVVAWDNTFGGSIIDYGTYPPQNRSFFAADDVRPSLSDMYPKLDEEQKIYAGLKGLEKELFGKTYYRETTKDELRIERILIDCSWKPNPVYQFIRASAFSPIIYPSKGSARTSTSAGVGGWKPRPGEKRGHHWRITVSDTGKGRMVQFDTDEWKTFVHSRLHSPLGGGRSLQLWGKPASPGKPGQLHEMFAAHCNAETSVPDGNKRGDQWDKWKQRPHGPDNHLWDCIVGAAVAGSIQGLVFSSASVDVPGSDGGSGGGNATIPSSKKSKASGMKFSEMQKLKAGKL